MFLIFIVTSVPTYFSGNIIRNLSLSSIGICGRKETKQDEIIGRVLKHCPL